MQNSTQITRRGGKHPLRPPRKSRIGDNRAAAEKLFKRTLEELVDLPVVEILWLYPLNPAEEVQGLYRGIDDCCFGRFRLFCKIALLKPGSKHRVRIEAVAPIRGVREPGASEAKVIYADREYAYGFVAIVTSVRELS